MGSTQGSPAASAEDRSGDEPGLLLRLVRDQRVAFLLVGGLNTVIGYGLFVFFEFTVGAALRPAMSEAGSSVVVLICAHIVSVLIAFVLYRRFVFRVHGHVFRDLLRFESVYLVAIGINLVTLPLLVGVAHIPTLIAQALIVVVTTLVSYFGHRGFSFRRPAAATSEKH